MEDKTRKKGRYFHRMMLINWIAYLIALNLAFMPYYISNVLFFFFSLLLIYFVLTITIFLKYRIERRYRKIEARFSEFLKMDLLSYLIFTILSVVFFLMGHLQWERELIIFIIFNSLILIAIFLSILNPMAKIWKKGAKEIEDEKFKNLVRNLAKRMGIGDVEMGILPWKKLKIANALQTGTRRVYVFLSDYLYENLTPEENLAVVAHEFAHIKLKHLLKIQVFVFSILLGIAYAYFLPPLFIGDKSTVTLLQLIGIWGGIIVLSSSLTITPRNFETQADILAAKYVSPEYLISALNKLSDLNFIPKDISKAWGLDHPSISRRIKKLKNTAEKDSRFY